MLKRTAGELLEMKGRDVWTIQDESSVYEAVATMSEKNVGALVVQSPGVMVAGIVSERDYARKLLLEDRDARSTNVSEIMTTEVITAHEGMSLDGCMALMLRNQIRHLPIVDDEQPVGVLTLGDIMKTTIREQSAAIEELESYVFDDQGGES
tara:strand:+ start:772 stop:1227 length:456 start_codon:yes stop_codon:yes gene_type:complete